MADTLRPRFAVTALVVSVLVTAAPVTAQRAPDRLRDDDGPQRVAILPFVNLTGALEDNWIGVGIAETLSVDLQNRLPFDVVPPERVSEAMRAVGVFGAQPGPVRLAELGRQLGVRWVVSGTYQRIADQLRITGTLVDVTTRSVDRTSQIDGIIGDLFSLQDQLATELQDGVRATREEGAEPREGSTAPDRATVGIDGPPPPVAPATITRDADGRATVRAVRLREPLSIDGTLDEAVYESVPSFGSFVQQRPDEGAPATEATEVWCSTTIATSTCRRASRTRPRNRDGSSTRCSATRAS